MGPQKKKKNKEELRSQSFLDTKLYETPAWIYANAPNFQWPSISEEFGKVKSALKSAKKKLRRIAGKSTTSLKKETIATGRGAISGISKMMARKIKSI